MPHYVKSSGIDHGAKVVIISVDHIADVIVKIQLHFLDERFRLSVDIDEIIAAGNEMH